MTIDVINIKKIGKIFINNKNKNFLSLKLILNFIFFTKSQIKKKNGISIPICFNTNINGISSDNYPTPSKRPRYSLLDKSKIKTTFNIKVPLYENSLEKCIKILKDES